MSMLRRLLLRTTARNRAELTFGFREAAILSIAGIAIAVMAAVHYAR